MEYQIITLHYFYKLLYVIKYLIASRVVQNNKSGMNYIIQDIKHDGITFVSSLQKLAHGVACGVDLRS